MTKQESQQGALESFQRNHVGACKAKRLDRVLREREGERRGGSKGGKGWKWTPGSEKATVNRSVRFFPTCGVGPAGETP